MKLSALSVDSSRQEAGDWIGDIPGMDDLRLKVRAIGNLDYRRMQAKLLGAVPKGERVDGAIDPATQDRIQGELFAGAVLIGWENLDGDDGAPVPYTPENAATLLGHPDYAPFRDAVAWAAGKLASERRAAVATDAGKSATPSAGA